MLGGVSVVYILRWVHVQSVLCSGIIEALGSLPDGCSCAGGSNLVTLLEVTRAFPASLAVPCCVLPCSCRHVCRV